MLGIVLGISAALVLRHFWLSVAKSAKAAIDALSTGGPNPSIVEALRHARDVAASAMTFLGEGLLNDERDKIAGG